MDNNILSYQHANISIHRKQILEDINLSLPSGQICLLLGPNGSGKSTLLHTLTGISHLDSGRILYRGRDLQSLSSRQRALSLAFLPQTRSVIPHIPLKMLVEHGRFPHQGFLRQTRPCDQEKVQEALEICGMSPYADQMVDSLSGGMRQRAFIAMVLAQDTPLIVLDEPTSYLDPIAQKELLELLIQLKSRGKSLFLVLHDLSQAAQIADHISLLSADRRLLISASRDQVLDSGAIEDAFHLSRHTIVIDQIPRDIFL